MDPFQSSLLGLKGKSGTNQSTKIDISSLKRLRNETIDDAPTCKRLRDEVIDKIDSSTSIEFTLQDSFRLFETLLLTKSSRSMFPLNSFQPRYKPFQGKLGAFLDFNYWWANEKETGQILSTDIRDLVLAPHSEPGFNSVPWLSDPRLNSVRHVIVACATGLDVKEVDESLVNDGAPFLRQCTSVPTRHAYSHSLRTIFSDATPLPSLLLWQDKSLQPTKELIHMKIDEIFSSNILTFKELRVGRKFTEELIFHQEELTEECREKSNAKVGGWVRRKRTNQKAQWRLFRRHCKSWFMILTWNNISNEKDILVLRENKWPSYVKGEPQLVFETDHLFKNEQKNGITPKIGYPMVMILEGFHPNPPVSVSPRIEVKAKVENTPGTNGQKDSKIEVDLSEINIEHYALSLSERQNLGFPVHVCDESDGYMTSAKLEQHDNFVIDDFSGLEDGEEIEQYSSTESFTSDSGIISNVHTKSLCELEEGEEPESDSIAISGCEPQSPIQNRKALAETFICPPQSDLYPSQGLTDNGEPLGFKLLGLDCEMVVTEVGLELARVTIVNVCGDVIYNRYVLPSNPVLDYLTQYSGITKEHLENTTLQLSDVQLDLVKLLDENSYIVGHSLDSDMHALKLVHSKLIDTVVLYPSPKGGAFKIGLRQLCLDILGRDVQPGTGTSGHDSRLDASAAMELALLKMSKGPNFGLPGPWAHQTRPPRESIFTAIKNSKFRPFSINVIGSTESLWSSECPLDAKIWTKFTYGYRRENDANWVAQHSLQGSEENLHVSKFELNSAVEILNTAVKQVPKITSADVPSFTWVEFPCIQGESTYPKNTEIPWKLISDVDQAAKKLYDSAESGTLLIVCCQNSMSKMIQLSKMKQKLNWATRDAATNLAVAGRPETEKWTEALERELLAQVSSVLNGVSFLAIKSK